MSKKAIIIGSGISGLSSACFLAKEGWNVTVLEKNKTIGGRARQFSEQGFVFDMGPSWYWMPDVFERFFNEFQKKVSDYYSLDRLDPSYRIYWQDGEMNVPANYNELKNLFESIEQGSGVQLDKFLAEAMKTLRMGVDVSGRGINFIYQKQLDKYFTIPYGKGVDSPLQAEETIKEAVDAIGQLQKIKDSHSYGTVNHKDGSASKVDVQTAHAVLTVHKSLNDDNKKKFADMVARSAHHMQKATEFSFSKVK